MGIQIYGATADSIKLDDIVNIAITDVSSTFQSSRGAPFYRKIIISHLKNKEGELSKSEITLQAERAADLTVLQIKENAA